MKLTPRIGKERSRDRRGRKALPVMEAKKLEELDVETRICGLIQWVVVTRVTLARGFF